MAIINGTKPTTSSSAPAATTRSRARPATTRSTAGSATTLWSAGWAMTAFSWAMATMYFSGARRTGVIEGGSGFDPARYRCRRRPAVSVKVPSGPLRRFDWVIGGPIVTLNDVERLKISPLAGADSVFIRDTTGTDLQQVTIDLAATVNGKTADTKTDTVLLFGTLQDNNIAATIVSGKINVTGMAVAMSPSTMSARPTSSRSMAAPATTSSTRARSRPARP